MRYLLGALLHLSTCEFAGGFNSGCDGVLDQRPVRRAVLWKADEEHGMDHIHVVHQRGLSLGIARWGRGL